MYHPRVKGSYYEMGLGYGSLLRKHGFKLQPASEETKLLGRKNENEVERVFPEILDEIRGFADGLQTNFESLSAFILTIGYKQPASCSSFAFATSRGVIFGRNYDFYYRFKKYTESYLTVPSGGYPSLATTDIFVGREDGVNEKGLAAAIQFVPVRVKKPGINFPLAIRYVLDKCANVQQAVKFLRNCRFLTSNNYLLADRSGEMAVVEACSAKVQVRKPEAGRRFIVATNHYVSEDMKELEDARNRDDDSPQRYQAIHRALENNEEGPTTKDAQRILSDHSGLICSHIDRLRLGTLWSIVSNLKQPRLLRAEGQPCKTKYREDSRLSTFLKRR